VIASNADYRGDAASIPAAIDARAQRDAGRRRLRPRAFGPSEIESAIRMCNLESEINLKSEI
jgi:hypothetical protein